LHDRAGQDADQASVLLDDRHASAPVPGIRVLDAHFKLKD